MVGGRRKKQKAPQALSLETYSHLMGLREVVVPLADLSQNNGTKAEATLRPQVGKAG